MSIDDSVKDFLSGVALIVDDQINDKTSAIFRIQKQFEENGTCFIPFTNIPSEKQWKSLNNISFAILDWDLKPPTLPDVELGSSFQANVVDDIVKFINFLVTKYVIPIFIFSHKNINEIERRLQEDKETKKGLEQKQIWLESKQNLKGNILIDSIQSWYTTNPAIYSIKEVERCLLNAQKELFSTFYKIGENWPKVVYQTIKADRPCDINHEFFDFFLSSICGRLEHPQFSDDILSVNYEPNKDEIKNVYSASKMYRYPDKNPGGSSISYTGDIYKCEKEYLVNITASCDLRKENSKLFLPGNSTSKWNKNGKHELLQKESSYWIPLLDDKDCIEFHFSQNERINIENYNTFMHTNKNKENKSFKRIGRLSPPYITSLQNRFGAYICRQGTPSHPRELFISKSVENTV